ncbi:HlyD family type I secretion periplasmic adaptor subunit [Motiliproteus sp.]|uniref:HlyD family type I secretion periplasmic adaptor subunit n=1 Tax=Motiliproteus sp. TaxID=1898955 RepID=UPI003BA8F807
MEVSSAQQHRGQQGGQQGSAEKASLNSPKKKVLSAKEIHEFLPAALEVEQTPASSMGQTIIWAIVLLFGIAAAWSWFGKVDIVAVASGKVIPSERVKQIQPIETGSIKAIYVEEGQYVNQGDPLVDLDNTLHQADSRRLDTELQQRQLESLRMAVFEQWLAAKEKSTESPPLNIDAVSHPQANIQRQQYLLNQQVAEIHARLQNLNNEIRRQQAEQRMADAEIAKKQRIIPVLKQRVDALDRLQQKKYGSRLQYLELQQELIEEEQDLLVQQARLNQLKASVAATRAQITTLISEQRKNNLAQKQDIDLQIASLQQELIKARQRANQQRLTAPISGHIQQLVVHTVGGVVTPAQVLMLVVPKQSQLEVEAMVLNKDIGFVEEGQAAAVKIDTFNFTKYGLIEGEIKKISEDAIQDENLGLVYSARVKLNQDKLKVENKWVRLSPGMSVTSEIKTGQRRLIEFFLSPLLRYRQESVRER